MNVDRKKILVIDNDPDILDVTRIILENMGNHEVVTSCKADLPIKLAEGLPDLILLDFGLQGVDSTKICKELRTQETTKNLPVVLFSTRLDVANMYQTVGADDFIIKPFDISNLLETITKLTSPVTTAPVR